MVGVLEQTPGSGLTRAHMLQLLAEEALMHQGRDSSRPKQVRLTIQCGSHDESRASLRCYHPLAYLL